MGFLCCSIEGDLVGGGEVDAATPVTSAGTRKHFTQITSGRYGLTRKSSLKYTPCYSCELCCLQPIALIGIIQTEQKGFELS
jgi:hypothetical protein